MNLLIADDEQVIRKGLLSLDWKSIGIEAVYSASNGTEVKELLLSEPIDLAIFDIKMPGMNGLELAGMIKEHSLDTAVLLLTGFSDFEYARQAIHYNVYEYILKPFRPREIVETVAGVKKKLEQKRYQDKVLKEYEGATGTFDTVSQVLNHFSRVSQMTADVLQDMATEYDRSLSLEELAGRYHFSVPYLSRKIKKETGYAFMDILKAIRMMNAARLLAEGERVNQACTKAGFNDQRYFSQIFRRAFGCSPSDFKKNADIDTQKLKFHSVLKEASKKRGVFENEK